MSPSWQQVNGSSSNTSCQNMRIVLTITFSSDHYLVYGTAIGMLLDFCFARKNLYNRLHIARHLSQRFNKGNLELQFLKNIRETYRIDDHAFILKPLRNDTRSMPLSTCAFKLAFSSFFALPLLFLLLSFYWRIGTSTRFKHFPFILSSSINFTILCLVNLTYSFGFTVVLLSTKP